MVGKINLTDQTFGKLKVISEQESVYKSGKLRRYWLCLCECGNEKSIQQENLKNGSTISCGCHKRIKHGNLVGSDNSPEWQSYSSMISRCTNPNRVDYQKYSKLGVDSRWLGEAGFKNFKQDMGVRPKGTSLDRINTYRGYSPDNCRWASVKEQNRNQKKQSNNTSGYTGVRKYTNGDYTYIIAEWRKLNGKRQVRYFNVDKYGEELAELIAIEYREKKLWELNKLGAGYSHQHGL